MVRARNRVARGGGDGPFAGGLVRPRRPAQHPGGATKGVERMVCEPAWDGRPGKSVDREGARLRKAPGTLSPTATTARAPTARGHVQKIVDWGARRGLPQLGRSAETESLIDAIQRRLAGSDVATSGATRCFFVGDQAHAPRASSWVLGTFYPERRAGRGTADVGSGRRSRTFGGRAPSARPAHQMVSSEGEGVGFRYCRSRHPVNSTQRRLSTVAAVSLAEDHLNELGGPTSAADADFTTPRRTRPHLAASPRWRGAPCPRCRAGGRHAGARSSTQG